MKVSITLRIGPVETKPRGGERTDHGARGGADDQLGVGGAPAGLGLERLERAHQPGAADDPTRPSTSPTRMGMHPTRPLRRPSRVLCRRFAGAPAVAAVS